MVAQAAGVTQPYIFHFFRNKEQLFKSVIDRAHQRIYDEFVQVNAPADRLFRTMGEAFIRIIHTHRDEILMVMQAHAIPEPAIREYVREKFKLIHEAVLDKFRSAGVSDAEKATSRFIGEGLLITVAEVLQLPQMLCIDG